MEDGSGNRKYIIFNSVSSTKCIVLCILLHTPEQSDGPHRQILNQISEDFGEFRGDYCPQSCSTWELIIQGLNSHLIHNVIAESIYSLSQVYKPTTTNRILLFPHQFWGPSLFSGFTALTDIMLLLCHIAEIFLEHAFSQLNLII